MQTAAAFSAPVRGIVYLNGRFAGECGAEEALVTPVSPEARLYAEFMPLDPGYIPCACAVDISRGRAARCSGGHYMISWPGNVTEIEFAPRPAYPPESEYGNIHGMAIAVIRGEGAMLRTAGGALAVPKGATLPDEHISGACEVFLGNFPGGRYMACFSRGDMMPLGTAEAGHIHRDEEGIFRGATALDDIAGHMRACAWEITARGADILSEEILWTPGGPTWPRDGESAAIAACQAQILGLTDEAEGYLAPRQRGKGIIREICRDADSCIPLSYPVPGGGNAVGILKREAENHGVVTAARYRAQPEGGRQGIWEVEFIRENG